MIKSILLIFIPLFFSHLSHTFVIELIRQNTPRHIAMNINSIPEYDLWLDSFKPYHTRRDAQIHGIPHKDIRTNDTIALTKYLDAQFYGQITVGNKSVKTFNILFDTTWIDSWLISSLCDDKLSPGCVSHAKYDHDTSSSYIEDGTNYTSNIEDYKLSGFWSIDFFYLSHINITHQSFIEMTDIPTTHLLSKADGVFGLGLKVGERNPFFYNLVEQGKIKEPIFSIFLNRDPSSQRGGSIFLGGFESKHIHVTNKVQDPFTEVPLNTDVGYWGFKLDIVAIQIGKTFDTVLCNNSCNAIVDSSSMNILTTQANVVKINKKINAKPFAIGLYYVDCNKINKLPVFVFGIQNKNFTLKGPNYISIATVNKTTICLSNFKVSTSIASDLWVLGGAFLSEYYSVYNIDKRTISFVKAA